jgi:GxxExxY protein
MHLTAESAEERKGIQYKTSRPFALSVVYVYLGEMTENDISQKIIGYAIRVHRELGPGLLESSYEECLYYELTQAGLLVERQKPPPFVYKEVKLDCGYRLDLLVENKVVVEVKSVESLNEVYMAQILTYLKLSKCKLGLLMNFNVAMMKEGIRRVVNKL